MNTVLHLARKDLTRHWIPALLVIGAMILDAIDTRFGTLSLLISRFPEGMLGTLIKWPLAYLFIVAIVQEDRVVDPRAHWLTRPIDPRHLLTAKLLLAVLVVVLPAALTQIALAYSVGANATLSLAIGAEVAANALFLSLLAVLIAALTRSVIESCLVVAALFVAAILGTVVKKEYLDPWLPRASSIDGASRWVVVLLTAFPCALGLLAFHYRRRSVAHTIGITATLAVFLIVLAHQFPWRLLPAATPRPTVISSTPAEGPPTTLQFKLAGGPHLNGTNRKFDPKQRTTVQERVVALPTFREKSRPDRLIVALRTTTTLHFADGSSRTYPAQGSFWDGVDLPDVLRHSLGDTSTPPTAPRRFPLNLLSLPPGDDPMPPEKPVRATAIVDYNEARLVPLLRHPANLPVSFSAGVSYRGAAIEPSPTGDGATFTLRQFVPTTLLHPDGAPIYGPDARLFGAVLRHRTRNEYTVGQMTTYGRDDSLGNIRLRLFVLAFGPPRNAEARRTGSLTEEWLAGAELILYQTEHIGSGQTKLELENLFIGLPPGEIQMR
jgi:hypothetical protein